MNALTLSFLLHPFLFHPFLFHPFLPAADNDVPYQDMRRAEPDRQRRLAAFAATAEPAEHHEIVADHVDALKRLKDVAGKRHVAQQLRLPAVLDQPRVLG